MFRLGKQHMKPSGTLCVLAVAVAFGAASAHAHHNTRGPEFAEEYRQARMDLFIERYDADDDRRVGSVEFEQARRSRFDLTDENGDGSLSSDEYVFEWEDRLEAQLALDRKGQVRQTGVRFGALDRDEDGRMTWEEYAASGERMFTRRDTDEDGVIDDRDPPPERTRRREQPDTEEARERRREGRIAWASSMLHMPSTHMLSGLMVRYDGDGDERITREEFDRKRRADFDLTDDDGNGWISREEYLLEFEDRIDRHMAEIRKESVLQSRRRFDNLDDDEDGAMTFGEYQTSGHGIFSRWDTDGNGYVSARDPRSGPAEEPREQTAAAGQAR